MGEIATAHDDRPHCGESAINSIVSLTDADPHVEQRGSRSHMVNAWVSFLRGTRIRWPNRADWTNSSSPGGGDPASSAVRTRSRIARGSSTSADTPGKTARQRDAHRLRPLRAQKTPDLAPFPRRPVSSTLISFARFPGAAHMMGGTGTSPRRCTGADRPDIAKSAFVNVVSFREPSGPCIFLFTLNDNISVTDTALPRREALDAPPGGSLGFVLDQPAGPVRRVRRGDRPGRLLRRRRHRRPCALARTHSLPAAAPRAGGRVAGADIPPVDTQVLRSRVEGSGAVPWLLV